jgi:hypothetical protein
VSSDGIDRAYEEDLKAEQGVLALHVDGRLKKIEPNTPAGRRRMDAAAFEALRTSDDVRVSPEGPGVEAGEAVPPQPKRPVSSRPPLAPCCVAESYAGPSGIRRRHAWTCKMHPGQPIGALTATVRDISEGRLARQHRSQTRRTGLDEAIADHPASYVSAETHSLIHPGEDAYDCIECSGRRS